MGLYFSKAFLCGSKYEGELLFVGEIMSWVRREIEICRADKWDKKVTVKVEKTLSLIFNYRKIDQNSGIFSKVSIPKIPSFRAIL